MTKVEALAELKLISYSTLCTLTQIHNYVDLDARFAEMLVEIDESNEFAFDECRNWMDIWEVING